MSQSLWLVVIVLSALLASIFGILYPLIAPQKSDSPGPKPIDFDYRTCTHRYKWTRKSMYFNWYKCQWCGKVHPEVL